MEVSLKDEQAVTVSYMNNESRKMAEAAKQDMVEKLQERIRELELELQNQKRSSEKGDKLLKVMWGDDFNDDSLH
ncbi:MAG: hypothetical protein JWR18_3143 [Segetibacter sp.]|jgi:hypothetical protein|nr:hypothetical protein [Segetibacter sp.]